MENQIYDIDKYYVYQPISLKGINPMFESEKMVWKVINTGQSHKEENEGLGYEIHAGDFLKFGRNVFYVRDTLPKETNPFISK